MFLPEILLHFYLMVYFDLLQGFWNKYQLMPPKDLQIHQYRQFWSSLGAVLFGLYSSSSLQELLFLNSLSNRKHVFLWSPLIPVKGTSLCIFSSIWECDPRFWTRFQFFKLLILQLVVIATCFIWISRGNNPVITTKAAVGEVRIAPVIARHANLWIRDSIALATPSSQFTWHGGIGDQLELLTHRLNAFCSTASFLPVFNAAVAVAYKH